jgi:hypothetical protein
MPFGPEPECEHEPGDILTEGEPARHAVIEKAS